MKVKFDKDYFDKHYADWNQEGYYNYAYQIYNYFHPNRILDVGCGLGYWIYAFQKLWNKGIPEVFGCDISEYAIKEANFNLQGNFTHICSITELDYCDNFADLVTCFDVLEHVPKKDSEKAIQELKRVSSKYILCSICFKGDRNEKKDKTHINIRTRGWWMDLFLKNELIPDPLPKYLPTKGGDYSYIGNKDFASQLILLRKID